MMTQPVPEMHLGDSPASELVFQVTSLCLRVAGFVYTLDFFYIGSTLGKEFYWHQIFLLVTTKVSEQLNRPLIIQAAQLTNYLFTSKSCW